MKIGMCIAVGVTLILLVLFGLPVSADAQSGSTYQLAFVSANGPPLPNSTVGETAQFTIRRSRPSKFSDFLQLLIMCDDGWKNRTGELVYVPGSGATVPISGDYLGTSCHAWAFDSTRTDRPVSNIVDFAG